MNDEAPAGEADRGGEVLAPGELAEAAMGFGEPPHRAGGAGGLAADETERGDGLALAVEVHVSRCGGGRGLAIVEEVGLAVDIDRHEPAAAQVAGFRVGDGEGEGFGDGGVDRIAALLQDLLGGGGAEPVRRGDRGGAGVGEAGKT